MTFRLTAICDRCDVWREIKQLPDHPAGWERELKQEGWGVVVGDDDLCPACLIHERDELAAARARR